MTSKEIREWQKSEYNALKSTKPDELITIEDHKQYIERLKEFREFSFEQLELIGKNFVTTLESLLSVGEDGVYSNTERFLYELIQNVDDCEYADSGNCRLDIQFQFDEAPGKIILRYNENGFTPENVFSITGIAEESKNIDGNKIEIGEKGIGFKSVFGIADSVLIESGMFSFEMRKDRFTIPLPRYDHYSPVKGTRMTLFMQPSICDKLFKDLMKQYKTKNAVLCKNPILFLNKLTHLRIGYNEWKYIDFDVERKSPKDHNDILVEEDVFVSIELKDYRNGTDYSVDNKVKCNRYTMPIVYDEAKCRSRYGIDNKIKTRRHQLVAIVPDDERAFSDYGVMYSFLPTQIKVSGPIALHVPYKLDGSRQYVDPQQANEWFVYTNKRLATFVHRVYHCLAEKYKERIIYYIPKNNSLSYLFCNENDKTKCLCIKELSGAELCNDDIFYATDGSYNAPSNLVYFQPEEKIENKNAIFGLLEDSRKLFIPPKNEHVESFGIKPIRGYKETLIRRALHDSKCASKIYDELLLVDDNTDNYEAIMNQIFSEDTYLAIDSIRAIQEKSVIFNAIFRIAKKRIKECNAIHIRIQNDVEEFEQSFSNEIKEMVEDSGLEDYLIDYLNDVDYRFFSIDGNEKNFALPTDDGIFLRKEKALSSFERVTRFFDNNSGVFSASLKIRQASNDLNSANEDMSNSDYLELLRGVRRTLVDAFGSKAYQSYLSIIQKANPDSYSFLAEVIQNADDCLYDNNIIPTIEFYLSDDKLVVKCNEKGFSKSNVRAITAIGDSTKKALLSGQIRSTIGEKGIGFKTVFRIAQSVEIHSNGFDFCLTDKLPTVPVKCKNNSIKVNVGTQMIFTLKKDISSVFRDDRYLRLFMCLRRIKRIVINDELIEINDDKGIRTLTSKYGSRTYKRNVYKFTVDDQAALKYREDDGKHVEKKQEIIFYIPEKPHLSSKYYVYAGLPTQVIVRIGINIDTPFELTTSREGILDNEWNAAILDHLYDAILNLIQEEKERGLKVLEYTGYSIINNKLSFKILEDDHLNRPIFDKIQSLEILPTLRFKYISAKTKGSMIIPAFLVHVVRTLGLQHCFSGIIVDTNGDSKYDHLLKLLGCAVADDGEVFRCLKASQSYIVKDASLRAKLYSYLIENASDYLRKKCKELAIIPVKYPNGTEYIAYNDNIFTHNEKTSGDGFYILDQSILKIVDCDRLLDGIGRINALTDEFFEARYANYLRDLIRGDKKYSEIAKTLLKEYSENRTAFSKCREMLIGMIDEIPMKMCDGLYHKCTKFTTDNTAMFIGKLLKKQIVSDSYKSMADYLKCEDIRYIQFDDIEEPTDNLTDDDVEEIMNICINYIEIIRSMYENECISDEQVAKYCLESIVGSIVKDDTDDLFDESFPSRAIKDRSRLRNGIKNEWANGANPYIEKKMIRWVPQMHINRKEYTRLMYGSKYNTGYCFCQMCGNMVSDRFVEQDVVEREPVFAWKQTSINLCLHCAKIYKSYRRTDRIWKDFQDSVMCYKITDEGIIDIPIGEREISFTAIHLAEIQEIFNLQGWGENAPVRIPKLGKSRNDEEEED